MLYLNISYNEKDEAKALGARWDAEKKSWYISNKSDYKKFVKWIDGDYIICDVLYILVAVRECFKCRRQTEVVGFGVEKFFEFDGDEWSYANNGEISVLSAFSPMSPKLLAYLQSKFNYKMRYSKTTQTSSISNCCKHCDMLQGDFFLFCEPDGPFFIDSKQKVENLQIYRIKLNCDFVVDDLPYRIGSEDWMIKQYGKIIDLDLEF